MCLDEKLRLVLEDLENTRYGPNAHVHAWDFRFREEKRALFQAVK